MISEDLLKPLSASAGEYLSQPAAFKEIFDALPLQVVVKSLRKENFGEFILWNKMAEKVLGIGAAEALGKTDLTFFSPEQSAFFEEKDREVLMTGRAVVIPMEYVDSRNMGLRILSTVKTPIFDHEAKPFALLSVSEDITDRTNTEEELTRALDFLTKINSELPGAVFQMKADPEGRLSFPYLSEGIHQVTGDTSIDMMSGKVNLLSRILPSDLPAFLEAISKSCSDMSTCRHEFQVKTVTGETRWALTNSSPAALEDGSTIWHGFITDVTEQKKTLVALRRGEERLHNALDAMRAAAWELDLSSGHLYLSPEWGQLFGYELNQYPTTLADLLSKVHPDEKPVLEILRNLGVEEWSGQLEFQHLRADGEFTWVLMSSKAVFANGKLVRQVGTLLDISERKRMESQLIEAKESAERASQAKGDFLAMMSHEIRTPLNAVLGFSELLAATDLSAEQGDYMRTIQDSSSALLVVLNDVLDYSKIESGKLDLLFMPMELTKVIRSAIDIFRPQAAAKGVLLHAVFSPQIPQYLLCDAARLSQIIHNLVSNAVKFTEKGEIRVELSLEGPNVGNTWPVCLSIRDTGIGIDLREHPLLFDPFYQADSSMRRSRGGTGLGLAIVRRLVSLLHGQISVESEPSEGTAFTISLPLQMPDKDEPLTEEDKKRVSMNLAGLLKKILIVEDNATNRRLLNLFLKKLGHTADEADNGFSGVKMASQTKYDVIFMDLEMPGMDGYEAAQKIRALYEQDPPYIVALTAHAMPEYQERSFRAGMQAYVSKPMKKDELAKILRDAFKR